jgi:hypothetical protein
MRRCWRDLPDRDDLRAERERDQPQPAEYTAPAELAAGANVLLHTILELADEDRPEARMSRIVTVGAAQLGPIARTESRASAVARMIALLNQAAAHGCDLVVFPECALTAFFPHWYYEREDELDAYFEREMPNAATQTAVRSRARARRRLLSGLCRAGRRRRIEASLQHVDPGRQERSYRGQVSQGPLAGPPRARAAAPLPESGEALL